MRTPRPAALPASDVPSVPQTSTATIASMLAAEWQALFERPAPERLDAFVSRAVAWKRQIAHHGDVSRAVREDLRLVAREVRAARQNGDKHSALGSHAISACSDEIATQRKASCAKLAPLPPASAALLPGTRLVKAHGGRNHVVDVLESGFRYEGEAFTSLSAIAKAITGTHWNGLLFFGLRRRKTYPKKACS